MSKIIIRIPISTKIKSAMVSKCFSRSGLKVLIEINEKRQEKVSNTAIMEVNSSMMCVSIRFAICNDVMTKRQKPKRFAEVANICGEVLFAISQM